jgi:hypothetical protein
MKSSSAKFSWTNVSSATRFFLTAGLAASLGCTVLLAQTTAGQDMKDAGHDTKNAAVDTGHATKTTTEKAYNKTKSGTTTAYHKTSNGTKTAYHKTANGTKTAYHKTANGTKTATHRTENAGDALAGKPAQHPGSTPPSH